jgi:hypothetical protein
MSNDFVAYIVGIKKSAQDAGFVQGTSVIDLTGSSPGTVFILNGLALKTPWLLGGYDGSKNFAKYYLDKMSCEEISQSWLLIAPDGPGKIPEDVLHPFGLDIKGDYQDVGQASRPLTPFPQHHSHHLLKPYSVSRATARCENIKKNENKE